MAGIGYGTQKGLGKGLPAAAENFINTMLAMEERKRRTAEAGRKAKTDLATQELLEEKKVTARKQREMMEAEEEKLQNEVETLYRPWFMENVAVKGSPWEGMTKETVGKYSHRTLSRIYELAQRIREDMPGMTEYQAEQIAMRDKGSSRSRILDTRETIRLEDGSTLKVYDRATRDEVSDRLPEYKDKPLIDEYVVIKGKGADEVNLNAINIETEKKVDRFLRSAIMVDKTEDEIAMEMAVNADIQRWAEYHYKGNGVFRQNSKAGYDATIGNKTGVSWETFKNAMVAIGISPREPSRGEPIYRKKEIEKETKTKTKAKGGKIKTWAETKALLESKGATSKEIYQARKEYAEKKYGK